MTRRRIECRNEVKTRLPDHLYTALQQFRALHGIPSDSAALERICGLALLGAVGSLPPAFLAVSAGLGQVVPGVHA